jgi:hypothetical protein
MQQGNQELYSYPILSKKLIRSDDTIRVASEYCVIVEEEKVPVYGTKWSKEEGYTLVGLSRSPV